MTDNVLEARPDSSFSLAPAAPTGPATDPCDLWRFHPQSDYFLRRGGSVVAPPDTANLALTNKCNLRCEICGSQKYLDQTEARRRHMPLSTLEGVAATLFPFLITVELNSQGDPLLYPQINRVIELIGSNQCQLKVQTNGTLFTDRIVELLTRQYGEVNISLDAVGPKFDEVRKGGVWTKAEPGLKRFLQARDARKLSVGLYPTVTRRTVGEAVNIADWAAAHDVDCVVFHRYSPIQDSFEEVPTEHESDQMREALSRWSSDNRDPLRLYFEGYSLNTTDPGTRRTEFASKKFEYNKLYAPFDYPIDEDQPGADRDFACTAPNSYVEIGLDGQLSVCCRSQESPVGYATSVELFADAWFGHNYQRIRQSLRRGEAGPYPLPNCEGCMKSFAPKAAGERAAMSYEAGAQHSAERLTFAPPVDFRIEGIAKEHGHCFVSDRLPPGLVSGHFDLWEDGRQLGPGGNSLDGIRGEGQGRYLIAGRKIYWATSDNSDPRRNLRSYRLRPRSRTAAR